MFRTFKLAIELFWVADILNLPFMEMFDTTYPVNGLFWCAAIILLTVEEGFEEVSRHVKFNFDKK